MVLRGVLLRRQKPRDPVVAYVTVDHRRQARRRRNTKGAQQIVSLQFQVSFFHLHSLSGGGLRNISYPV